MQSVCRDKHSRPLHVAIIMDGNGRWALARGLPRDAGHHAGLAALREVVGAAPTLGIATLTVFAFSVDNWRRPASEVEALLGLLTRYLEFELAALVRSGVRLTVIGRRDRLPAGLVHAIRHAESVTAVGQTLNLRIAFDYSSRDAILAAASACRPGHLTREALAAGLGGREAGTEVDLLIRTSGEQRLSDFMLWEAAYAELLFVERLWPDFGVDDLAAALRTFHLRERRFGALAQPTLVTEVAPACASS